MKVLFTFGGLPHYYNNILNRLNGIEGLEIVVVIPKEKGATLGKGVHEKEEGIDFKIIRLDEYKTIFRKPFLKNLPKIINDENPDILVTIWPYILTLLFNPFHRFSMRRKGIKILFKDIPFQLPKYNETFEYYLRGTHFTEEKKKAESGKIKVYLKSFFLKHLRKFYYSIPDAHLNYVEEALEILPTYGVKPERIFITYNSPDTDLLLSAKQTAEKAPCILEPNPYRIIHVGRLVYWKRVDLLIKATSILKKDYPKVELIVIGNGPKKKELQEFAAELNAKESMKFIGGVYDSVELGKYMLASSVYVLAGMGGLSINEAMVFDKPVICSVCDGTEKKLVREGYNGKYFLEGDEVSLAEKIRFFFDNTEEIHRMGVNSGKIIKDEINIHTVIERYIRAFNHVTQNRFNLRYQK